ncbi:MAG: hypothetical protein KDK76_02620 [Chlamydiia bacterium]|nr:hypothetical protein [Chlamydiia bacterium]
MVSKKFFYFIFLMVGGASLWLGGQFFYDLYHYFQLNSHAPAQVSEWRIVEKKPNRFSIEANYEFCVEDRTLNGVFHFSKPVYQNPYLAEDLLSHWKEKNWKIWFNADRIHEASLQKIFPIKRGVYFALSLAVMLYFAILNLYVTRERF